MKVFPLLISRLNDAIVWKKRQLDCVSGRPLKTKTEEDGLPG